MKTLRKESLIEVFHAFRYHNKRTGGYNIMKEFKPIKKEKYAKFTTMAIH